MSEKNLMDIFLPVVVLGGLGIMAYYLLAGDRTPALQARGQSEQGGGGGLFQDVVRSNVPTAPDPTRPLPGHSNQASAGAWTSNLAVQARESTDTVYYPPIRFVEAGPQTPTKFFAPTGTVSTSRALSPSEQEQVVKNLYNSGISDAWWNPIPPKRAPNTPVVTTVMTGKGPTQAKTCRCPGSPGCRAGDSWTYC